MLLLVRQANTDHQRLDSQTMGNQLPASSQHLAAALLLFLPCHLMLANTTHTPQAPLCFLVFEAASGLPRMLLTKGYILGRFLWSNSTTLFLSDPVISRLVLHTLAMFPGQLEMDCRRFMHSLPSYCFRSLGQCTQKHKLSNFRAHFLNSQPAKAVIRFPQVPDLIKQQYFNKSSYSWWPSLHPEEEFIVTTYRVISTQRCLV